MALQGDGNGIVTIPTATASGTFSVVFDSVLVPSVSGILIGDNTTNAHFMSLLTDVRCRVNTANVGNDTSVTIGDTIKLELRRDGADLCEVLVDDVISSSATISGNFVLNAFFTFNNGALKYSGLASNLCTMTGFTGGTRTYNFEGSGTTLVDTTSGQNGTLTGFTSGGFTTPSTGISITSLVNDQCRQRDQNNQAQFTVSGEITGGTATTVEYQLDNGPWLELDSSPTTSYTGTVTVTNEQDISVRWSNDTSITATVERIKAAACIAAWWQSNEAGRGLNNQPISVGVGNPTPAMYRNGVFSALQDPTGTDGNEAGSTWPRIAQQYSDAGIPVCIGNVAVGSTTISTWQPATTNYNKIVAFADAVGGLEFTTSIGGESDQLAGTTQALVESRLNTTIDALHAAYGTTHYLTYYPAGNIVGGDPVPIYTAFDNVVANNPNCKDGGDLRVIGITTIHLEQDADLTQAADIRYTAFTLVSSTLNMTGTNTPDGTYLADVYDNSSKLLIETRNINFSSGNASEVFNVPIGSDLLVFIKGNNPPTTGIAYTGNTV